MSCRTSVEPETVEVDGSGHIVNVVRWKYYASCGYKGTLGYSSELMAHRYAKRHRENCDS